MIGDSYKKDNILTLIIKLLIYFFKSFISKIHISNNSTSVLLVS